MWNSIVLRLGQTMGDLFKYHERRIYSKASTYLLHSQSVLPPFRGNECFFNSIRQAIQMKF